jgi:excisionase family DNA binding protein
MNDPTQKAERQPRLLTLANASVYSGLTQWKLRALIRGGRLPIVALNTGEKWWIDREDLDSLIARSKKIL